MSDHETRTTHPYSPTSLFTELRVDKGDRMTDATHYLCKHGIFEYQGGTAQLTHPEHNSTLIRPGFIIGW